ncbi:MAG: ATP synthase F1 subunit epsilon [Candidatus Levybacteria bacterium]|nr:ATP synthase F1 subunit epsilon [Candidatus Levybacteria bacterium]
MILEIVTPEKIVLSEEIDQLTAPTTTGEITVLPKHVGLLTKIISGELTIKKGAKTEFFAITGGFLEVEKDKITILADYAVRSEEIEVAKAIEAQKQAEKLMKDAKEKASEKDFALAESELRRAILELKVAHRRRKTHTSIPTA